jgi:putative endonuclease
VRLAEHEMGLGSDFTSRRQPTVLVFTEPFEELEEARSAELQIKGWSRAKKEALIRRDYDALPELARTRATDTRRSVLRQAQEEEPNQPSPTRKTVVDDRHA